MKKSLFAILFLSAVLAAGSYMLLNSRRMQLFGTLVARVETTQKRVALTFDDAPTPQTLRVLALLKQYRIPATFYAVGSQLERYPEIARSIVADGHELGNHSYSHQRFVFKTWDFTDNEISRTERLIRQAGYAGEITFRPPYGKKLLVLPWYLSPQHPYCHVGCRTRNRSASRCSDHGRLCADTYATRFHYSAAPVLQRQMRTCTRRTAADY